MRIPDNPHIPTPEEEAEFDLYLQKFYELVDKETREREHE